MSLSVLLIFKEDLRGVGEVGDGIVASVGLNSRWFRS